MQVTEIHPAINAALNLTSFVFLVAGRVAIARGDDALHKKRMLTAFASSTGRARRRRRRGTSWSRTAASRGSRP